MRCFFMNILDCSPNFGTLSAGFESFQENEVVEVLNLEKDAHYGYNSIHKQWFPKSYESLSQYEPENNIDLAIFNPEYGGKVSGSSKNNFFFYDFQDCLNFLERLNPEFAIFKTEIDVIPLLNNAVDYVRDGFGQLSKDRLIYELKNMGYKPHLIVIDEADYGIPLHRSFAFYIATPNDFNLTFPKSRFTATGRGKYSKYRSVADAIGDLEDMGEWVEYNGKPRNSYQRSLRNLDSGKVTWHIPSNIKESTKQRISIIKQGSNNDTSVLDGKIQGYKRAKWNTICTSMGEEFYTASGRIGMTLHPLKNRPFSIREGCRIHGLPDRLSFELKTPKKSLGKMIHESVAPAIGEILALALQKNS